MCDRVMVGDRVRSFDFEGRDDCYVEGVVTGYREREGCTRYAILVDREVFNGEVIPYNATRSGMGRTAYPPVNGTPKSTGGICDGVKKIGEPEPRRYHPMQGQYGPDGVGR